ncbi:MAG: sigma-70 family RNA polymerase sigma factor [Verrucomicrobiae bacterium]|nr:sigma-70 family RNA polymerase sigma factor [Verrucomicrobiae bacterium]
MPSVLETVEPAAEREQVTRAQSGDMDAFTELVVRHQRQIHALAYRLTGSVTEAEDLAQETFIRAWRQIGTFRGESAFHTWLCRIAVHLGLNWKARRERRREDPIGELALPDRTVSNAAPAHEAVTDALQRLPADQRAAVVLTVYEGLNHAEAARVLGCAETTVSWRVWLARRSLRRWLSDLAPNVPRNALRINGVRSILLTNWHALGE